MGVNGVVDGTRVWSGGVVAPCPSRFDSDVMKAPTSNEGLGSRRSIQETANVR